jgi:hypothetical protein
MGSLSTLLLCFALIEHVCVQTIESTLKNYTVPGRLITVSP